MSEGIITIPDTSNNYIRLNTSLPIPNKLIINNTLSVSQTKINTGTLDNNLNGYIEIKDRIDGQFKTIYLEDNDLYLIPQSYDINGNLDTTSNATAFVREDQLYNVINDSENPITLSNVHIANAGHINFMDENSNTNLINAGFRLSSLGKLQFRNEGGISWYDIGIGVGAGELVDLSDVQITDRTLNQVLLCDGVNFTNSNFSLSIDATPSLGGNLTVGDYYLTFNDASNGISDETSNSLIRFSSNNTTPDNYFLVQHNLVSAEKIPQLTVDGSSSDIPLEIASKGDADININANDGEINFTALNVQFDTTNSVQFNSGFIKKNITEYTHLSLSNSSSNATSMNIATNILTFNISGDDGRYYANLPDGVNGQTMDIFFDFPATNSNNQVEVSFGVSKKIGTGSGLSDKLIFATPGQGASLVYLVFNSGDLSHERNRWQVINTGAIVA